MTKHQYCYKQASIVFSLTMVTKLKANWFKGVLYFSVLWFDKTCQIQRQNLCQKRNDLIYLNFSHSVTFFKWENNQGYWYQLAFWNSEMQHFQLNSIVDFSHYRHCLYLFFKLVYFLVGIMRRVDPFRPTLTNFGYFF